MVSGKVSMVYTALFGLALATNSHPKVCVVIIWASRLSDTLCVDGKILFPAYPSWRAFSVEFFKFLSRGSSTDPSKFPIDPVPIRLMPGGLDRIVPEGFALLGTGMPETRKAAGPEPWMKPVSGEKLVYRIASE
jgi:hypothetical protein